MSKKLLAAAVAAAVTAPMAVAADSNNVVIYGKAHVMVLGTDREQNGNQVQDNVEMSSTNSRLGFKGTEDLGNGLKAIWKYETTVNISDGGGGQGDNSPAGGGTFGSARNAYVGLSSNWGTVLIGRHDTPYKVAWYAAGNDHLDGSIVDFNAIGSPGGVAGADLTASGLGGAGAFQADRRVDNAIAYISPSFSGFTVAGAIVPGEDAGGQNSPRDGIADHYSLGAMWSGGGFKASAGYEVIHFGTGATDEEQWFLAGSATFGMFTVGASYEDVSDFRGIRGAGNSDKSTWGLAGKVSFGNNDIIANYADGEIESNTGAGDLDYNDWGIAFQHNLSKRTSAYVAYNDAELDLAGGGKDEQEQYGIGMIHTF